MRSYAASVAMGHPRLHTPFDQVSRVDRCSRDDPTQGPNECRKISNRKVHNPMLYHALLRPSQLDPFDDQRPKRHNNALAPWVTLALSSQHGLLGGAKAWRRQGVTVIVTVIVNVQEVEAVGHYAAVGPTVGEHLLTRLGLCHRRKGLVTLIDIPIDLAALVFRSTHHATSGKHCIGHRICLDVATSTDELNLYHNKVVDVFKVVSYTLLRKAWVAASNHKISGGTDADLAGDMPR